MYERRLNTDWAFTDAVHNLALQDIYKPGFTISKASSTDDLQHGIDYWSVSKSGKVISIQERFRTLNKFTENSDEFTLRYGRPNSQSSEQTESEFFKIKAQMLLYGITETADRKEIPDKFKRWVIVDVPGLLEAVLDGSILIDENENNKRHIPYLRNSVPVAVVKNNYERGSGNSSLLIFSVSHILRTHSLRKLVLREFNYSNIGVHKNFNASKNSIK